MKWSDNMLEPEIKKPEFGAVQSFSHFLSSKQFKKIM